MAGSDYPILLFPTPGRAERERRFGGGGRLKRPSARRQGERLAPQFQRLQEALAHRRAELQGSSLGIEPEQVLVLKTVGTVENFIRAVEGIEGLEWLAEYGVEEIAPGDGFEDPKDPEKSLSGQLFLIMSDQRALAELRRLFDSWRREPEAPFSHGLAPLKHAFESLREIRPWGVEDRLAETGLLEDWRERVAAGQELVPFEADLWYRGSESRRSIAHQQLRHLVHEVGGEVVTECTIRDIAYHAMLGRIDITRVQGLLNEPALRREVALFRCDDIMFVRPVGQCATPVPDEADDVVSALPGAPRHRPLGAPVVALLDGLPLTQHTLLDGRLVVDDPDGHEGSYQARERSHGTAMASLMCHGDLDAQESPLDRQIYVRPIMKPRRGFDNNFVEAVPEDVLPVDLLHRAVRRLFDGEGGEPAASPEIRVVNLSVGDPARPFITDMSAWARLLDWLAWKYGVLFVVSAGNHSRNISFPEPAKGLHGLGQDARQREVIMAVAKDTRHRRLLSPGETLNGLTVGAVHGDQSSPGPSHLIEPVASGLPSVISAHGPGYRRAIKPDILLPGGRQMMSEQLAPPPGRIVLRPHASDGAPGQRVATPGAQGVLNATHYTRGTSNAAALASRGASVFFELLETLRASSSHEIPDDFDAVLIKALLVHGARWDEMFDRYGDILRAGRGRSFRDYVARFLGYGLADFGRVAQGAERRVTVLGFGSLDDREAAVFSLPLPPSLSGAAARRRVIITLAWFSPINSRRRGYRVAHLWFGAPGPIASDRSCADFRAAQRGTVQHEVFEGMSAIPINDGDEMTVKVNCRKDAGDIVQPVRFGLAVTLEVAKDLLLRIPIHQEVRERIAVRVKTGASVL